jgi:phytanoyl-CoA hydroxylase
MPASTVDANHFTPSELEQFLRDGFIVVRGLANAELVKRMKDVTLDGLRRRVEPLELEADVHYPGAPHSRDAAGGGTIRRLKQAHSRDYVFTEWLTSPPLVGRLRQILGSEVVCPLAHHN